MSEWMPIETAPKDGTRILLFCNRVWDEYHNPARSGHWFSEVKAVKDEVAYRVNGWWLDGFDHPFNEPPFCPTHWMPLPNPPKDEKPSVKKG